LEEGICVGDLARSRGPYGHHSHGNEGDEGDGEVGDREGARFLVEEQTVCLFSGHFPPTKVAER
jgi:hypothetical protein